MFDRHSWVTVMLLNPDDLENPLYAGVRGGLTTGHWTRAEANHVGERLQTEIAGLFAGVMLLETWDVFRNGERPVTVQQFLTVALGPAEADRTRRTYQNDPLVTGKELGV